MAYSEFLRPGPWQVEASVAESRRFGLSVGRLSIGIQGTLDLAAVVADVRTSSHDVVVLRYPAQHVRVPAALLTAGCGVLPADTLLYFALSASYSRDDGLPVQAVASPADRDAAAGLFRASFTGYANHYAANPRFSAQAALEGYVEWAMSGLDAGSGRSVLLHREGDELVGASTTLLGPSPEVPLVAIAPGRAGRGLYRRILAGAEQHLIAGGASTIHISTQAHNLPAVRTFAGRGYRMVAALTTLHVSPSGVVL